MILLLLNRSIFILAFRTHNSIISFTLIDNNYNKCIINNIRTAPSSPFAYCLYCSEYSPQMTYLSEVSCVCTPHKTLTLIAPLLATYLIYISSHIPWYLPHRVPFIPLFSFFVTHSKDERPLSFSPLKISITVTYSGHLPIPPIANSRPLTMTYWER